MDLRLYGVGGAVFSEGGSLERSHLLMRVRVVIKLVARSNQFIVEVEGFLVAIKESSY